MTVPERALSDRIPRCTVIVPTYNGEVLTGACVEALLANPPETCRSTLVVVDDASTDGTVDALARFGSDVRVVQQAINGGFARACNAGARAVGDCDYLVFLNNDTLPVAGWLDALVHEAEADDRVGAVGARLLFPRGQVQHAGVAIGQDRWPHHLYAGFDGEHQAVNRSKEVIAATAACLLVRRGDFEALDGFDPAFHNGYEDIDLCLRLWQRGRRVRYCPRSVVYHLESATRWPSGVPRGTETSDRLFAQRWGSKVVPDDLKHYIDDGLLEFSYGSHYPLTMTVSPELAVTRRQDEKLSGLERLLNLRSRQVMDMMGTETRRRLTRSRAAPWPSPTRRAPHVERLVEGHEHRLGDLGEDRVGKLPRHRLISVVMPVKNGEPYLHELLSAVLSQAVSARLEIVAVDSGSEDATVEILERFGASVFAISAGEFDHGLTRNLAAERARGDVLVFMSQRARPADARWLAPLIASLDNDPLVAGACSRVIPDADADPLTRRDLQRELSGSPKRRHSQIEDASAYRRMSPEQRRRFLNFHTVSAAIRTETWRQIPFRAVQTIGEDLLWAREVVEAGWALVHEPASVVCHSHSYTLGELFSRNVDDGVAGRDIVGRTLAREEIVPMISAMAQDDWSYLRHELALTGDELERWQLESVLRRTAQAVGQWVGINHESLPEGTAAHFSGVVQSRGEQPAPRREAV